MFVWRAVVVNKILGLKRVINVSADDYSHAYFSASQKLARLGYDEVESCIKLNLSADFT